MITVRRPYPSDISDEEWSLIVPYLLLMKEDAEQRHHDLRAVLRLTAGKKAEPTTAIIDSRTLRSTPESGLRSGYDGAKRKNGSKLHMAVDTLGHLPALHVTPANRDDRAEAAKAAEERSITLEIVRLPQARQGFVLLPRRWIVERSFAWATRRRRLVKDYERRASTLAAMHTIAFAGLMLKNAAQLLSQSA